MGRLGGEGLGEELGPVDQARLERLHLLRARPLLRPEDTGHAPLTGEEVVHVAGHEDLDVA